MWPPATCASSLPSVMRSEQNSAQLGEMATKVCMGLHRFYQKPRRLFCVNRFILGMQVDFFILPAAS